MDLMLEVGQLRKKLSSICAIGKKWVVVGLVLLIVMVLLAVILAVCKLVSVGADADQLRCCC